jgi:hypothetical protein
MTNTAALFGIAAIIGFIAYPVSRAFPMLQQTASETEIRSRQLAVKIASVWKRC